jgi:hypothetical protein
MIKSFDGRHRAHVGGLDSDPVPIGSLGAVSQKADRQSWEILPKNSGRHDRTTGKTGSNCLGHDNALLTAKTHYSGAS